MRIRIIRNTIAGGVPVEVGQVIEANDADARTLLALRKAIIAEDVPVAVARVMTTESPETAALVATETAMRPRGKPRKGIDL